jgi:hypothetical protein
MGGSARAVTAWAVADGVMTPTRTALQPSFTPRRSGGRHERASHMTAGLCACVSYAVVHSVHGHHYLHLLERQTRPERGLVALNGCARGHHHVKAVSHYEHPVFLRQRTRSRQSQTVQFRGSIINYEWAQTGLLRTLVKLRSGGIAPCLLHAPRGPATAAW